MPDENRRDLDNGASAEMPRYKSHKEVWALKIKEFGPVDRGGGCSFNPVDEGFGPVHVSADYIARHNPMPGGYYVVYADGYKSFSPAAAFEEGYTRANAPDTTPRL